MEMTFEAAMKELEEIVLRMQDGTLTLDQSLKEFEKAIALVKFCNETLAGAEQKIRLLGGEEDVHA